MYAIQEHLINRETVRAQVDDPGCGAVLVFDGIARNNFQGRPVRALQYSAYPELALPVLRAIGQEMQDRWQARSAIVHRTGRLRIGESSVVIAVACPHRDACYEASRYAIEELKKRLPVWKKEVYEDDGEAWKPNSPA